MSQKYEGPAGQGTPGEAHKVVANDIQIVPPKRRNGKHSVVIGAKQARGYLAPGDAQRTAEANRIAGELGVTPDDVLSAVDVKASADTPSTRRTASFTVTGTTPGKQDGTDGTHEVAADDLASDELATSFASGHAFYRWPREALPWLAAVDLDLPDGAALIGAFNPVASPLYAERMVGPRPALVWQTRSGGARWVFERSPRCPVGADELGLIAVLLNRADLSDEHEKAELLSSTRRPPREALHVADWIDGGAARRSLLRAARGQGDFAEVPGADLEWQERTGRQVGERLPHTECPIDPCETGGTDPVVALEDGLFCHRCDGVHGRGFALYSALLEGQTRLDVPPDPLAEAALNMVPWSHAQYIAEAAVGSLLAPKLRERLYRACLRALHLPEPPDWRADEAERAEYGERYREASERIDDAMSRRHRLVRVESGWAEAPSLKPRSKVQAVELQRLPGLRSAADANRAADPTARLEGWLPLRPLPALERPMIGRGVVYVPRPMPRPTEPPEAIDADRARELLREMLPGWNESHDRLLRVLLVGTLRARWSPPTPCMLVLQAPSGAGKLAVSALATAIAGAAPPVEVTLNSDDEAEVTRALGTAQEQGGLTLIDEAARAKGSLWTACAPLLKTAGTIRWRKLYVGPVTTPVTAPIVLASSTLPDGATQMRELARRAPLVRLRGGELEWGARGNLLELRHDQLGTAIADALLAEARELAESAESFQKLALGLGATRLDADEEDGVAGLIEAIRALWKLWQSPERVEENTRWRGRVAVRFQGAGYGDEDWSIEPRDGIPPAEREAALALRPLVDRVHAERNEAAWHAVRGRLETADLQRAIGRDDVALAIGKHRRTYCFAFQSV